MYSPLFMAWHVRAAFLACVSILGIVRGLSAEVVPSSASAGDLGLYANPMFGTGGKANLFPGAVAPFGMIQWSPDTEAGQRRSGYSAADTRISGFSLDHVSGAGCSYGEDFQFMPILGRPEISPAGNRTAFATTFSHQDEVVHPGSYAVTFANGIAVELTTTVRTGFGRFHFPGQEGGTIAVNVSSDANGVITSGLDIDVEHRAISGFATGGFFCHAKDRRRGERTIYFYAIFDQPFAAYSVWSGQKVTPNETIARGTAEGAFLNFARGSGQEVYIKVAISYVSVANARLNLEAENPPAKFAAADFALAVKSTADTWNSWLHRIEITGGTESQRRIFYSMLYHALIAPGVVSDANGEYRGYDGQVHRTEAGRLQYGFFSGWDVYRTECALLGMIATDVAGDMAQSLVNDYEQNGTFPRWGVATQDSGTMVGDPAAPMLASFHAFGVENFDQQTALRGLLRAASDPKMVSRDQVPEREGWAEELSLGYIPEHTPGANGSVSVTLEYATADFALAEFAARLGDAAAAKTLRHQAQNWRNLFNPETKYLQMRRADGSWAPGFVPGVSTYDKNWAFVEGTGGQYVWMVPFDLQGLADAMGGIDAAAGRLDQFLTKLNDGFGSQYCFIGNEPSLAAPWLYDFLGRPYKTQYIVRKALTELFRETADAYPGNDDLGTLSAWYIFGALGIYPEIPGSDVLVIGSPLFPVAKVRCAHGDLIIKGENAGEVTPYVESLKINGRVWDQPWVRFAEFRRGGILDFKLSGEPNPKWGSAPTKAPPSYGN